MITDSPIEQRLIVKVLEKKEYQRVWKDMQDFTCNRNQNTVDEIWFVEHLPVFTLGQAGLEEHILTQSDIPVCKVDRGGQVTYHGPGQLVVYPLINIQRKNYGVRQFVSLLEKCIMDLLMKYDILGHTIDKAPGVYIDGKKIASVGLKIKKGSSFHGIAININMDLSPFLLINPCGYQGLLMTQTSVESSLNNIQQAIDDFIDIFSDNLGYHYLG